MLRDDSLATIERFWAGDLGCSVEDLRRDEIVATRAGRGIFIFARAGTIVALPPHLPSEDVVGPAFIGYADATTFLGAAEADARLLDDTDGAVIAALRSSCSPIEWEHGGASPGEPAVGAFRDGELTALSSYSIWGDRIAHIGIVTHPQHRGQGCGRAAVSAMTRIVLERGLVAQYRTLVANAPSMAIARRLGFERYAVSLALRSSRYTGV
jgi:GNAT superfamily N-acetyltransferase